MDNDIYIVFKDGTPHELVRGDFEFRRKRVKNWQELFPEFIFSISDVGLDLLEQYEY